MTLRIIDAKKGKLTDADIWMLAEIEEHPEIAKWDSPTFKGDMEKAYNGFKEFMEKLPQTDDEFLIAKLDGKIVGFVGIHRFRGEMGEMKHVGEIGIAAHPDFQKRGVGAKLLVTCLALAKERRFARLEADTLANNIAMRRLVEKVGFKLEGIRQKRFKKNGEYFDEACYAVLLD
jgi:ribosomal-protein-alanine N-acetyltransferase